MTSAFQAGRHASRGGQGQGVMRLYFLMFVRHMANRNLLPLRPRHRREPCRQLIQRSATRADRLHGKPDPVLASARKPDVEPPGAFATEQLPATLTPPLARLPHRLPSLKASRECKGHAAFARALFLGKWGGEGYDAILTLG